MNTIIHNEHISIIKKSFLACMSFIFCLGFFLACEGPEGPQGQTGEQGPEGPVGPAGEDGSLIYSGQGAPGSDLGSTSDYYLDTDSGELYGPKDSDGWGNPIMVLLGEGAEDGSQIYAGTGAPASSRGSVGDYYLDKNNYDMYGPKTDQGWGSPINLKGVDGNANVTRYIAPAHDYSAAYTDRITIDSVSKDEMLSSSWLVYLVETSSGNNTDEIFYTIPGPATTSSQDLIYNVRYFYRDASNYVEIQISAVGDNATYGRTFDRTEIVQIEDSSREDLRKSKSDESLIPDNLDTTNYYEVAEYYGFK